MTRSQRSIHAGLCLAVLLAFPFAASPGSAAGLGSLVAFEHTQISFPDHSGFGGLSTNNVIVAFSVDTAVVRDTLFNYRATAGPALSLTNENLRGYGFVTKHNFGFGLYRGTATRVGIGPTVRMAMISYEGAFSVAFGAGAELGLNVRVSPGFSLSISTGYQATSFMLITSGEMGGGTGVQHVLGLNVAGLFLTSSEDRQRPTTKSQR